MENIITLSEAFVYCWTDLNMNKLYVGVHKGQPDDGYVCSSKLMKEEYIKRPQDFERQIIGVGTYKDCYALETAILKATGADKDTAFYNQSVNGGKFNRGGIPHTEEWKREHSLRLTGRTRGPCSEITKQKISKSNTGKIRTEEFRRTKSIMMRGNKHLSGHRYTEESKKKIAEKLKGNRYAIGYIHTQETREKISRSLTGRKRGPYRKIGE